MKITLTKLELFKAVAKYLNLENGTYNFDSSYDKNGTITYDLRIKGEK